VRAAGGTAVGAPFLQAMALLAVPAAVGIVIARRRRQRLSKPP